MKKTTHSKKPTNTSNTTAYQLGVIAEELRQISSDIESLSFLSEFALTPAHIVELQKIDFCSQKIADLAAVAERMALDENLQLLDALPNLAGSVKLEYMKGRLG